MATLRYRTFDTHALTRRLESIEGQGQQIPYSIPYHCEQQDTGSAF